MLGRPRDLRRDQCNAEGVREPACDLILQSKQIPCVTIEPLCPKMYVRRGIDQLRADANLVARPPDASFNSSTYHTPNSRPICFVSTGLFL
jgi:hypothetical protein